MTTLATDGTEMAADGLVCAGNLVSATDCPKIERLSDGRIVGAAGDLISAEAFRRWMRDGQGELPLLDEEFEGVVADGSSHVVVYDFRCRPLRLPTPYAAGSGRELAMGAMLAGKSPTEAVEIACTRDVYSGGSIITLNVGKTSPAK